MILVPAIPQDLEFHNFSDQRTLLNIPHFWNVVSNVPFVLIGLIGLYQIPKNAFSGILEDLIIPYKIFFLGLILVGLGSGYYHLDPTNNSLVWDRMAITISFMSFFTISIGESVSIRVATRIETDSPIEMVKKDMNEMVIAIRSQTRELLVGSR